MSPETVKAAAARGKKAIRQLAVRRQTHNAEPRLIDSAQKI
jgi:hypothetical protein